MIGFFNKRNPRSDDELLNRKLFETRVKKLREKAGYGTTELPIENLVLFFATNIADVVFQVGKNSAEPENNASVAEKAATVVVCTQLVKFGVRTANINEADVKSKIMENSMVLVLQADPHKPSPEAQAEMSLAASAYQTLASDQPELLITIDERAAEYLERGNNDAFTALATCWRAICDFIEQGQPSSTDRNK